MFPKHKNLYTIDYIKNNPLMRFDYNLLTNTYSNWIVFIKAIKINLLIYWLSLIN